MRILVIGRDYPTRENQMTGLFEFEQAQMLVRHGHDVFFLFTNAISLRHIWRCSIINQTISRVNVVGCSIPLRGLIPYNRVLKLRFCVEKRILHNIICKQGIPDIIIVHYPSCFPFDIFSDTWSAGSRIIAMEHWSSVQNMNLPARNKQYLQQYIEHANAFICVGKPLREAVIQLTGCKRNLFVIPNIVSPLFFYRPEDTKQNKDVFRFLAVGRLSKEKGYDKLIEAFCQSFGSADNVFLDIVGGGSELESLLNKIKIFNAAGKVRLHSVMSRSELADFYHTCNALVMPSDYETFGVPAIEAMACGLPVIVTQNTGVASYINESVGMIIKDNKVNSISDALIQIIQNFDCYDRRSISEYSINLFSEEKVYNQIEKIFMQVQNGERL